MSSFESLLSEVIARYLPGRSSGGTVRQAASGLSGSHVACVVTAGERFRVRAYPSDVRRERIATIHAALNDLAKQGCRLIAGPLAWSNGSTILEFADRFWETSLWLPGRALSQAEFDGPHIAAALRALAEFHIDSAKHSPNFEPTALRTGRPEVLVRRLSNLAERKREVAAFALPLGSAVSPLLRELAAEAIAATMNVAPRTISEYGDLASKSFDRRLVLRDVWCEHVLFENESVSGIIDYDALGVETPCGDIARLLGSIAGDDESLREIGLSAYADVRPLTADERLLIAALDHLSVILTPWQWLDWLVRERREFASSDAVRERLEHALLRLKHLNDRRGLSFE